MGLPGDLPVRLVRGLTGLDPSFFSRSGFSIKSNSSPPIFEPEDCARSRGVVASVDFPCGRRSTERGDATTTAAADSLRDRIEGDFGGDADERGNASGDFLGRRDGDVGGETLSLSGFSVNETAVPAKRRGDGIDPAVFLSRDSGLSDS